MHYIQYILDDKVYKPASVADRISMAKNNLLLPQQYAVSSWATDDMQHKRPMVANIYNRYAERCRQANAMDFDDLLVQTYVLLRDHEDVRKKYVERFQYVLVDEYQDTNFAQQAIVLQLTREHGRVCVVGDDAQSIYSFRGANIDNILDFQKQYDGARLYKLEQNYRSTQLIVQAANSLIRKNERQIRKDVFSENEEGERSATTSNGLGDRRDVSLATLPFCIAPMHRAVRLRNRCARTVFRIVSMVACRSISARR